jgi:DNA-binding NarL/FixJ family response regulator
VQGAVLTEQSSQREKSFPEPNHVSGDRSSSLTRVLLVDDNEPFRRFVRAALSERPDLQVISEASDGLEAVEKAAELQPGLIVLDIGLPSLNGIEAARRIRNLSPKSKILFLSQESSPEVVQEALRLGALGFVTKAQAGSQLLAAVEAVCRNEQFVGCKLNAVEGQD